MRRVLLIADLEGITGVETIEALVAGAPGYPAAAARMTEEVALVARLLRARGVEEILVSDTHHSGAETNLDPARLPPGCELRVEADPYGGALLDGAEAVVCVGMHAGGRAPGFGAHTVLVNAEWTLGDSLLSETHVVRLLAAERGVPLWLSAGDDVLEAQLGGEVPFVRTKQALSRGAASSLPLAEVEARFREVLEGPPAAVPIVPRAPLRIRFQRAAEARASGGRLISATEVEVAQGDSFAAQYAQALELLSASERALFSRLEGAEGSPQFLRSAARLLLDPWEA